MTLVFSNAQVIGTDIKSEVMTVTPEMALDWITSCNVHNRKIKERHVKGLAAQLQAGLWTLNGDAIRFDRTGKLLDGQHRLYACVEANISFDTLVVTGLDPDAQDTMDIGKNRNVGDVLDLAGVHNPRKIATVASFCMKYSRGELVTKPAPYPPNTVKEWVMDNLEALQEAYAYVQSCSPPHHSGLSWTHLAFLYFEASRAGYREQAKEFIYGYATRTGVERGTGVHRLIRFVDINNRPNAKPNSLIYCWMMFYCFIQHLEGRKAERTISVQNVQDKLNRDGFLKLLPK